MSESNNKFERIIEVEGAYDKRSSDPSKSYGVHGMNLRFVLKGPKGATQFLVFTNIYLSHVADEMWARHGAYNPFKPMGVDIGYHAKEPQYDGQECIDENCKYTGGKCYYDGSGLMAENFMPTFISEGSEAVWPMLEKRYADWLEKVQP